jgi:hypothetical protein
MVFVVLYIALLFIQSLQVDMRMGKFLSPVWLYVPQSLLGILSINGIAAKFMNNTNILSIIGRDSMSYYCLHWIIILAVSIFFPVKFTDNFMFFYALILANIVLLPLLNYGIKHSKYKGIV